MKDVTQELSEYLNTAKHLVCCDLYELLLSDGTAHYYTDADIDIEHDGKVYQHNALLIKRKQVKLHDRVVVDNMDVTIHAGTNDKINGIMLLKAAHDGTLDRAKLHLSRCFFDDDINILGVIGLFGGNVEVKKCGGLQLDLTVKAQTQGLAQEFPRRKYYPQGAYSTVGSTVTAEDNDSDSCLIAPFVPLKEVLL